MVFTGSIACSSVIDKKFKCSGSNAKFDSAKNDDLPSSIKLAMPMLQQEYAKTLVYFLNGTTITYEDNGEQFEGTYSSVGRINWQKTLYTKDRYWLKRGNLSNIFLSNAV